MALSSVSDFDRYEHPMPETFEHERVLRAIDEFLYRERNFFPDLIERTTLHTKESTMRVLDPHRDERIDHPTRIIPGVPVARRIEETNEADRRREIFDGGIRGFLRRIFGYPPRNAETMLEPAPIDPHRGTKAFSRREVLGAAYMLEPERAERIMHDPADPRHAQFTQVLNLLRTRLGDQAFNEWQSYPALRWAMSFIVGIQPEPPNPDFNIAHFVAQALNHNNEWRQIQEGEEARNRRLTPEELVYRLFWHYFTTRQNEGGFLDNNIPDHWISQQNIAFHNQMRGRALLAARFAISEAEDQNYFSQLYSNSKWAEHLRNQRNIFSRFISAMRSTRFGNKIAMAFGRPEQASFNTILERIRAVEITREGKTEKPFARLELENIITRGDIRKALAEGKLSRDDLILLAGYIQRILRESLQIEMRPSDAEMAYRTIRNLRLVYREIIHRQFIDEARKEPGSMPRRLRELFDKQWAEEDKIEREICDAAQSNELIQYLEKANFDARKKEFVRTIINDLKAGTIGVDEAIQRLNSAGYKIKRTTGIGLWSRAMAENAKDAVSARIGQPLAAAGITAKNVALFVPKTLLWRLPKRAAAACGRYLKQAGSDGKEILRRALTE